jgi:hypothetical protein
MPPDGKNETIVPKGRVVSRRRVSSSEGRKGDHSGSQRGLGLEHARRDQPVPSEEDDDMADSDVATQKKPPSMEEIIAQQQRRLEEARKAMQEAAKDPDNREALNKGKGHDGGGCLHF